MRFKIILTIAAVALVVAGCNPTFPVASIDSSGNGTPITGGACAGDGQSSWPQDYPHEAYQYATRDSVSGTGIHYSNSNPNTQTNASIGNGFTTFVQTTGGLNVQSTTSPYFITGCTGADNENTTTGNGDGPSNFGVVARLQDSCGGCIQAYPKIDQGMGNFNPSTGEFDGNPSSVAIPFANIDSMVASWNMPSGTTTINGTSYTVNDLNNGDWEQAFDIFPALGTNCGSQHDQDIMMWNATSAQRRGETYGGMSGSRTSQTAIHNNNIDLGGSLGTVNVDWGYFGQETVLALHTNVTSGSFDVKKLLDFGQFIGAFSACSGKTLSLGEVNLGWELARTSSGGSPWTTNAAQAFQNIDYALHADVHKS